MKLLMQAVLAVALLLMVGACTTIDVLTVDMVEDTNHVIDVPEKIDQEEWAMQEGTSLYNTQSLLYSELGSRFYNLGERELATAYFEASIDFDRYNSQAHFALGSMAFEQGDYVDALFHFQQIRRQPKVAPYDIDYYKAAQMYLDFFPFEAKVTAIDPTQYASETPLVIINRGRNQGVREGMEFTVYRQGNRIRDVESLEVIGQQRTPIAEGVVTRVNDDNALVEISGQEGALYVQLDDVLETDYLAEVPEPSYADDLGAEISLGVGEE